MVYCESVMLADTGCRKAEEMAIELESCGSVQVGAAKYRVPYSFCRVLQMHNVDELNTHPKYVYDDPSLG